MNWEVEELILKKILFFIVHKSYSLLSKKEKSVVRIRSGADDKNFNCLHSCRGSH